MSVMMLSVGVVRMLLIMLSDAHIAMLMGCAKCDVSVKLEMH